MPTYEILHNPRCAKSRETLDILLTKIKEPRITLYLENPPTKKRIKEIATLLGVKPIDMIRTKEPLYKILGLTKQSSDEELFTTMTHNPILIERPIVIKNNKRAIIGRPPETVLELI